MLMSKHKLHSFKINGSALAENNNLSDMIRYKKVFCLRFLEAHCFVS